MKEARQCEQEAHGRPEVAVDEATARTRVDMLHELVRIGHAADNTVSIPQSEILNLMSSLADNALQGKRSMLMSEASAELQKS